MGLQVWLPLNKDTNVIPGISSFSKEGSVTFTEDTDGWYKVVDSSHTSSRWGIYYNFDVKPSTTYTLTVYSKSTTGVPCSIGIGSFQGAVAWPAVRDTNNTSTEKLTTYTWTTTQNDIKARIYLAMNPGSTVANNYVFYKEPKVCEALTSQGLSNVTVTNNGAIFNSAGKLGGCYKTSNSGDIDLKYSGAQINTGSLSLCGWFKFNKAELAATWEGYSFDSTHSYPTGNLIGNNSYGGVGLIWYTNSLASGATFTSLYTACSIRSTANGARITNVVTIPFDTWVHLALVFNKSTKILELWLNGELKVTSAMTDFNDAKTDNLKLNYKAVWGGNGPGYNIPFLVNDIRIYDHALSQMEVKEIAKGLILHYTLGNKAIESTTNLFHPLIETSRNANPAWDKTLNGNYIIHCDGFGDGYNGGVSNPTMGYHGHWTYDENNILIGILPNLNSVIGQTNRWLGLTASVSSTSIGAGNSYTISWEQKTDNLNCYVNAGYYYKKNSSESGYGNFHDGTKNCKNTLINIWQPMEISFTLSQDWDGTYTGGTVYFYGHYGSEGTTRLRNLQFETKNHATAFVNGLTTRTSNIIYDCSGFCNNGTIFGNLVISNDMPKYSVSTYAVGSSTTHLEGPPLPAEAKTAALWIKGNKSTNGAIFNDKNSGLQIGLLNSLLYMNSAAATAGFTTTHWKNGEWNHVVVVNNNGSRSLYVNGQPETQSGASNYYIHNADNFWLWNRSYNDNYAWTGDLSDFRVYATALSADDIKSLYESNRL